MLDLQDAPDVERVLAAARRAFGARDNPIDA